MKICAAPHRFIDTNVRHGISAKTYAQSAWARVSQRLQARKRWRQWSRVHRSQHGNIASAILAVLINFKAQEMGFNLIGKATDDFPNYLLSTFSVRRQWAAEHRDQVVHFLKALLRARKWLEDDRTAGAEFLAKDLQMKRKLARQGLDYYLDNRAWGSRPEYRPRQFEFSRRGLRRTGGHERTAARSEEVCRS